MSALAIDPVPARTAYHVGAPAIPVPAPLRRYVRGPRHFALVLESVAHRTGGNTHGRGPRYAYHGARLECAQDCLRRLGANLGDPVAADLLLLLVPPVACGACGEPYLRESPTRAYCSDRCRRLTCPAVRTTEVRIPLLAACACCDGPLTGARRRYCGEDCERMSHNARQRARWQAARERTKGATDAI